MPVTNYYSVNGEIIGEKTTGSSRIDYLTDALGSVTATMDQSAQVVNTYRYRPYGAQLAKTGAGTDPSFQWVGSQGYRQTGKKYSDVYIRARHYDTIAGRWTTKDLRPSLDSFLYVRQRITNYIDPSGLQLAGSPVQAPALPEIPGNGPWGSYPFDPGGLFSIWLPYAIGGPNAINRPGPTFCPGPRNNDCLSWPDLCAWANSVGLMGNQPSGRFRHGTLVCCHGRIQECVAATTSPASPHPTFGQPESITRPGNLWRACILVHENTHKGQNPFCLPGMVGIALGNHAPEECAALIRQFNCLLNGASRACKGFTGKNQTECFNQVYQGLSTVCKSIQAVCKNVPNAPTSCGNVVEAYNPNDARFSPY